LIAAISSSIIADMTSSSSESIALANGRAPCVRGGSRVGAEIRRPAVGRKDGGGRGGVGVWSYGGVYLAVGSATGGGFPTARWGWSRRPPRGRGGKVWIEGFLAV
jgi:hypothetical protein